MPKLNKFRVVNLIYNNTRHIYDETFDFNNGDNAMMLLDNGGGKTVLTQMMLQTVIPKTDLKSRKFSDYFKNNSKPTMLMSEWKLDSEAGSLLTGLIVKNRTRKVKGRDEDRESLEIHAFVIHYHFHETWNIDNIPVVSRNDQGRKAMRSYDEIVADLYKHEKKHSGFVSVMNWSDSSEAKRQYKSKLAEYGIVQQEWKDNILKINKEEAGLKSFFEDSKTSHTLLRRKILPIIESKLEENNQDKVELKTLVKNYAIEQVKNSKIISDEKIYNGFLEESSGFEKEVYDLSVIDTQVEDNHEELSKIYNGFSKLIRSLDIVIKEAADEMENNTRIMANIDFEKESFKYYEDFDEYSTLMEKCQSLVERSKSMGDELALSKGKRDIQIAARLYGESKELISEIEQNKADLNHILEKDKDEDIEGLLKVLQEKYKDRNDELNNISNKLKNEIDKYDEEIINKEKDKNKIYKSIKDLEYKRTTEGVYIKQFDDKVAELNKKNNEFIWEKNPLVNDYEASLLREYNEVLSKRKIKIIEEEQQQANEHKSIEDEIKKIEEDIHKKEVEKSTGGVKLQQIKNDLEKYRQEYRSSYNGVKVYGFEENIFFDNEFISEELKSLVYKRESEINHLTLEKAMVMQLGESLKTGQLQTLPDQVFEFLNKNEIDFQYGYKWLLEYKGENLKNKLYMEEIRILPYSLIMEEDDLIRFKKLDKTYNIASVIPIITYDYISSIIENNYQNSEDNRILLHTSFDINLLDGDYVASKIENYGNEVNRIDQDTKKIKDSIGKIRNTGYRYRDFISKYNKNTKKELEDAVNNLDERSNDIEKQIGKGINLIKGMNDKLEALANDMKGIKEEEKKVEDVLSSYRQLEKEYDGYQENKENSSRIAKDLKNKEKELLTLEKEIIELKDIKDEKIREKEENKRLMEDIILKTSSIESKEVDQESIEIIKKHPYYQETLESLEIKHEAYNKNHGDVDTIRKLIQSYAKSLGEKTTEINSLNLYEDDYSASVYDETYYRQIVNEIAIKGKEVKGIEEEIIKGKAKVEVKEDSLKKFKKNILARYNREELTSRAEIIDSNFKKRITEILKENKVLKKWHDRYSYVKSKSESSMKRLGDSSDVEFKKVIGNEYSTEMDIDKIEKISDEIIKKLKTINKKRREKKNDIARSYTNLSNKYRNNELLGNMFTNLLNGDKIHLYDFVKRVLDQTRESISRTMEKYAADLKNMKEKEESIYRFALTRVSDVYDELKDIDKHSYIDLNDKRQKMLFIKLPKKDTIDILNINHYIKDIVRISKKKIESGELSDLDKYLDSHLNLEEIFDVYIPLRSIKINIAKIEQNNISKISWENVSKTSGGEVFVSVFILFISLMSYTRGLQLSNVKQGKVIVMDNPFGPVSSGHLLQPLFKIAKTYDTQLICFTHINTSAITSQFDLIYSLRVVKEAGSSREHLDVELAKDASKNIESIESNLFEIGDGDQLGFL